MKIWGFRVEVGKLPVIDVEVERVHGKGTVVGDGQAAGPAERHVPIGVSRPALRGAGDRQGTDIAVQAVAHAKEVPDRGFDRWGLFAVPISPDDELPAVKCPGVDGRPDMVNGRRALDLGQNEGGSRLDPDGVGISPGPVIR